MFPVQESVVSVPRAGDNGVMESFFARPNDTGPFPGLVVIHEAFGLNDNIREITRQFAAQGYAALAVDLFSNRNRILCMLQAFHGMLIRPLNNSTLSDLQSTMAYLRGQAGVDGDRRGAVGERRVHRHGRGHAALRRPLGRP